jgi:hypothetical protein
MRNPFDNHEFRVTGHYWYVYLTIRVQFYDMERYANPVNGIIDGSAP